MSVVDLTLAACVAGVVLLTGRRAPSRGRPVLREAVRRHAATAEDLASRVRRWRRGTEDVGLEVAALVGEVAALLRAGTAPTEAWREAASRRPVLAAQLTSGTDPSVRSAWAGVRAATALSADVGAPPADVLDHCRAALAEAADAETARRTALAGPQASARLLAALPLLGLALGVALGADPLRVFTDGRWGTACLLLGALLMVSGHRWVAHEVSRARDGGGA